MPDQQFRKRNPVFAESETYNKHKALRKKTRKEKAKGNGVIQSTAFSINLEMETCICPGGKELMYLGNNFEGSRATYSWFQGELPDCRACPLQSRCMKNPIK